MITLYNTLSRKKEELHPIHKDWVGLYTCGPTVYNFAHIGNLRTYIFEDILQRTLQYNGYKVKRVMNITDVGHLTSDADAGDDKLDKAAQAQKKSVQEIAQFYTDAFFDDLKKLNIEIPESIAPASQYVPDQIAIIEELFKKGIAYDTPTAVYFNVSKFKNYGKLSGQSLAEKIKGARSEVVIDKEKHNAADFALWFKLEGKFKNHLLYWPSPWGEGFPGWHIECSAISRHFLGQPFDIHTGGVDHIGTHHENEIAQSEAAFGIPLANIWMHGEFLNINDGRMGKSEGNFITLTDLEKKGFYPLVFRYFIFGAHYRTKLNFTWEALEAAKNGIERLYRTINDYYIQIHAPGYDENKLTSGNPKKTLEEYEKDFKESICNDLNIPQAIAIFHDMLNDHGSPLKKLELVKDFDRILGLKLDVPMNYSASDNLKVAQIAKEYQQFRDNKQFVQSDALRKEIEALGYSIRDTEQGPYIVKNFF
jgi:cysteinyl-tRNA synthetase